MPATAAQGTNSRASKLALLNKCSSQRMVATAGRITHLGPDFGVVWAAQLNDAPLPVPLLAYELRQEEQWRGDEG